MNIPYINDRFLAEAIKQLLNYIRYSHMKNIFEEVGAWYLNKKYTASSLAGTFVCFADLLMMVKADSRLEKVIELRHNERLLAFIVPFTRV